MVNDSSGTPSKPSGGGSFPQLDRGELRVRPLGERRNKVWIERDQVPITARARSMSAAAEEVLDETTDRLRQARRRQRSRVMTLGAHAIKNGLAPVLIELMERGWITHLATNGAGIIHDWELAFQGATSEDVREGVARGEFGIWRETGLYLNLAILVGAFEGLGYGESVGRLVEMEGLSIPAPEQLKKVVNDSLHREPERAAAAADLLAKIEWSGVEPGRLEIRHPFKHLSVQAAAHRHGIPFTGHPMFGHDIIYCHPMSHGAAIGRAAELDFLRFAHAVSNLEGGVYLSVGSAVMSPMVFEKSLSMAQNLAIQDGRRIDDHYMVVVDLQESRWDWSRGEPPEDNPDYYLRHCKTFSRMGGTMRSLCADNRDFLLGLLHRLERLEATDGWQPREDADSSTTGGEKDQLE
jgi:hypothetical protein